MMLLLLISNSFISDHKKLFATLIARNAKDIDVLIDSLPSEESSAELQVSFCIKIPFQG